MDHKKFHILVGISLARRVARLAMKQSDMKARKSPGKPPEPEPELKRKMKFRKRPAVKRDIALDLLERMVPCRIKDAVFEIERLGVSRRTLQHNYKLAGVHPVFGRDYVWRLVRGPKPAR